MTTEPAKSDAPSGETRSDGLSNLKMILITIVVVLGTVAIGYFRG